MRSANVSIINNFMKIRLSPEIIEKIPGITVHVMVFNDIRNGKKISNISQLLRGAIAEKKRELKDEVKKKKIMGFLKNAMIDNKTLKEAQLLKSSLNKIGLGREVVSENSMMDLAHYLSLKYLVPVLGRDLDSLERDLEINFIIPRQGKKAEDLDYTRETVKAVLWLIDIGSMPKEDFEKLPEEFSKVITKYCGGQKEAQYTLNADALEVDLNYVSQKEMQYQEEQKRLQEEQARLEKIRASNALPFLEKAKESETPLLAAPAELPVRDKLSAALREAVEKYLSANNLQADPVALEIEVETPHDQTHGDYAANIAMKLGKIAGRPPREIADEIIKLLPPLDYVEKTEIAGPGFINFHFTSAYLQRELDKILSMRGNFGRLAMGKDKTVIIDYSSPNIAKPLGVHHLLSTIIGQTIADILRFCGYKVISANYLGDWGTQYGKMIYAYKTWGSRETVEKDPLNEMLKLYVKFHDEAEKDPTLEDRGREEFKKLEEGDVQNKELLDWMREISIKELERIYKILGVRFDEYLPESMYPVAAKKIIEEGKTKGVVVEGEKGALIVKFENDRYVPYILQKSDGTTIYGARDLASIKDRLERLKADILLYVVDVAQSLHFNQLFETAHKYGFTAPEYKHVVFGRMQLPEGPMSTRKGEVILLDEVLKEAVQRAEKLLIEKSPELSVEERARVAREMAVSAIKYNIISQNRETNITFDWERMLTLEGNSGPYLEYACARAQSILRKNSEREQLKKMAPAAKSAKNINQTDLFSIAENLDRPIVTPELQEENATPYGHEAEKKLLRMLPRFPEYMEAAARDYKPNHLTTYLFDLARAFSTFYNEVPVLNAARVDLKATRLKLVQAVSQVLRNGLQVLGIAVFERM